jgi:uncharacterized protein YndB with AHSA1/START domain
MSTASFTYVIYIHATADEVWNALVDPDFTRRYWFHENISDWTAGSDWIHQRTDLEGTVDIVGKVIESAPPDRLVVSWALPDQADDAGATSRVEFDISPQREWPFGPWVGLRVVHSELVPDSEMHRSISFGWPAVLSGVKSIIESPAIFDSE